MLDLKMCNSSYSVRNNGLRLGIGAEIGTRSKILDRWQQ